MNCYYAVYLSTTMTALMNSYKEIVYILRWCQDALSLFHSYFESLLSAKQVRQTPMIKWPWESECLCACKCFMRHVYLTIVT